MASRKINHQPAANRAHNAASERHAASADRGTLDARGHQATPKTPGNADVHGAQHAAICEAMAESQWRNEAAGLVVQWLDPVPTLESVCGLQRVIGMPTTTGLRHLRMRGPGGVQLWLHDLVHGDSGHLVRRPCNVLTCAANIAGSRMIAQIGYGSIELPGGPLHADYVLGPPETEPLLPVAASLLAMINSEPENLAALSENDEACAMCNARLRPAVATQLGFDRLCAEQIGLTFTQAMAREVTARRRLIFAKREGAHAH
jgi:hypothetical protein